MTLRLGGSSGPPREHAEEAARGRARLREAVEALVAAPPGFIEILEQGDAVAEHCREHAAALRRFERIVVLGIGGSALGARTIRDALAPDEGDRLVILDNIDPDSVVRMRDRLDPRQTGLLVVSKSGSTAETAAQLVLFTRWLTEAGCDPAAHITLITDPEKGPLRALAGRGHSSLEIPPRVGGRFSVLTPVGLLPAALLGVDPSALLEGGRAMWHAVRDREDHPLLDWVVEQGIRSERGGERIQVVMSYSDRLRTLGDWFAQLWGESLGKRLDRHGAVVHRGSTPLPAVGATDQHSLVQLFVEGPADKQFLILGLEPDATPLAPLSGAGELAEAFGYLDGSSLDALFEAERVGTIQALRAAGRPVTTLQLSRIDARTLGALFVLFELATVLAAELLEVDPYEQPGVEGGKIIAFARMGRAGYAEQAEALIGGITDEEPGTPLL
ncbi:MAG: glucose-6-phosphate isomerase [Planctomycetota bacterium]